MIFFAIVNIQFFEFYKEPINVNIFGIIEDDTTAIFKTIWKDFPVVTSVLIIIGIMIAHTMFQGSLQKHTRRLVENLSFSFVCVFIFLSVVLLAVAAKGTFRAMALGQQHVSVTSSQFLNNMVPSGITSFRFAWKNWKEAHQLEDLTSGLRRLGFRSKEEALAVLRDAGHPLKDAEFSLESTKVAVRENGKKKNLVFFLMESWGTEPILYQSPHFDVLGSLNSELKKGCYFSYFDSSTISTFAATESLLFSSPISPLTLGKAGLTEMPWSIPHILKNLGYRTIFLTSARSGWHQMNTIMQYQGFEQIIDSGSLSAKYPGAELGVWGVWDEYAFKWLKDFLETDQDERPYFIFVLTSTNHSPYDAPKDFQAPNRDASRWLGESGNPLLEKNLNTYFYASDNLGKFISWQKGRKQSKNTIVAATGDHNGRTFGVYATPERRHLLNQVPFVLWGTDGACGDQLNDPASHRDIFPTIFSVLNIETSFPAFGRNLLDVRKADANLSITPKNHRSLNYLGYVRNDQGSWRLGDPRSFVCLNSSTNKHKDCRFDAREDAVERANLGMLDWSMRWSNRTPR